MKGQKQKMISKRKGKQREAWKLKKETERRQRGRQRISTESRKKPNQERDN